MRVRDKKQEEIDRAETRGRWLEAACCRPATLDTCTHDGPRRPALSTMRRMEGTLFVCPACGLVELSIVARLRVAGDEGGAESWLAAISCRHCLFDGVAGLVTGQRGRTERVQQWHAVARDVSAKLVSDLRQCPAPTSEACACSVHQRYGVVRDGRWTGLDAIPAPDGYRSMCPDPIPIRSADELLALLDSGDGETRATAIKAAYSFDDPRIADRLVALLDDPWQWAPGSSRNRHHAALELARRGDPRAVDALIRIVDGDYHHPDFLRRQSTVGQGWSSPGRALG